MMQKKALPSSRSSNRSSEKTVLKENKKSPLVQKKKLATAARFVKKK